jgi:hypothetical protein
MREPKELMIGAYDVIGLIGVSCSVYCYARVQWQRDYAKRLNYSLLNLAASALLALSLLNKWNLSSFIVNAMWGVISLYGVYRCLKYIRASRRQLK